MDSAAAVFQAVNASLYQRLGGAEGVAAAVDEAVDRHAANPTLAARFHGQDLPSLKVLGVDFLSASAGGPRRELPPQYAGMSFSADELRAVAGDLVDALSGHGLDAAAVREVVGLLCGQNGAAQ